MAYRAKVVIATYLNLRFTEDKPQTIDEIHASVLAAGHRRIRPCLMTTATTVIALLPVLTSTGRGADLMIPMAVPIFGGMMIELITPFVVPEICRLTTQVCRVSWDAPIRSAQMEKARPSQDGLFGDFGFAPRFRKRGA